MQGLHPRAALTHVLPPLLMVCVLATLASLASYPVSNPDTFLHLRLGEEFLSGRWSAAHPGHVSSFESASWAPTQWLSQIVFAVIDDWFGVAGLAWFSGFLFLGLAVTLYLVARREASPLPAAVVVVLVLLACGPGLSLRPQVTSFILTAVISSVWRSSSRTGRLPWVVLPLTWLWAMCHGMWPVALVIGGVSVVGMAMDRRLTKRRVLQMGGILMLSCVVPALTPVGPRLISAVVEVNSRRDYFAEWGTPDFGATEGIFVLVLLALTLALMARQGSSSWSDLFLLMAAGGFAVYSLRTVPIAATALAPLTAAALDRAIPRWLQTSVRRDRSLVVGAAVVALAGLAVAVPRVASDPAVLGRSADQFFDGLPAGTVVLDDMTIGSYLIWRHPDLDVVAHGYADVYTDRELDTVARMARLGPGWINDVRATGADLAVLADGSPLAAELASAYGWSVAWEDDGLEVLRAPTGWLTGKRPGQRP